MLLYVLHAGEGFTARNFIGFATLSRYQEVRSQVSGDGGIARFARNVLFKSGKMPLLLSAKSEFSSQVQPWRQRPDT